MAKVLLIDDDVDFIEMNTAVLLNRGFEVAAAYSAAEARERLKQTPIDLVVLDVMMETAGAGFDLAREIHQQFPELPVLMLTGVREAKDVRYTFEPDDTWLPVTAFLEKPVDPALLAERIEKTIRTQR